MSVVTLRCPSVACVGWSVEPQDRFCAWCGGSLQKLKLQLEWWRDGSWQALDEAVVSNAVRPAELRLRVIHLGLLEGALCRVQSSPEWLQWDTEAGPLAPGEALTFALLSLQIPAPSQRAWSAPVTVELGALTETLTIHFAPVPVWKSPERVPRAVLHPGVSWTVPVQLEEGLVVVDAAPQLDDARFQARWDRPLPFALGATADSAANILVGLQAGSAAGLDRDLAQRDGGPLSLNLKVAVSCFYNGKRTQVLPLRLQATLHPELRVHPFGAGRHLQWKILADRDSPQQLTLMLCNGRSGELQRERLRIDGLQLSLGDGRGECPATATLAAVPLWLESGEQSQVAVRLPQSGSEAQTLVLTFWVQGTEPQRFYLHLDPVPAQPFPGWLAVDLGHAAVCAAWFDDRGRREVIHWEPGAAQMPATMVYTEATPARRFLCGRPALEAALRPDGDAALVPSAKQALQQISATYVVYPMEQPAQRLAISAADVLADQLTHVVRTTMEQGLQRGEPACFPTRLLLAHPARFGRRQAELLRASAEEALRRTAPSGLQFDPDIVMVCEPVAASLDFLAQWDNLRRLGVQPGSAAWTGHVLVYDCGGQTVDLSLLRVSVRRGAGAGQWYVKPELLGLDGFPDLAGAWVTRQLAGLLLERCQRPVALESLSGLHLRQLLEFADRLKIALQETADVAALSAEWDAWCTEGGFGLTPAGLPPTELLEARCEAGLNDTVGLCRRLLARHGVAKLEAVLRVGQGAQLRQIAALLQRAFPEAAQLHPDSWKQCVVLGCGRHPVVEQLRGLRLADEGQQHVDLHLDTQALPTFTTSRWGIKVETADGPRFLESIPAGQRIPDAGFRSEIRNCQLRPGRNRIHLLENLGHSDGLKDNPEIVMAGSAEVEVPESGAAELKVVLYLDSELMPSVELWRGKQLVCKAPAQSW